jgi:hypothetical protein
LYLLVTQLVAGVSLQVSDVALLPESDRQAYMKAIDSYYAARPVERLRALLNIQELLSHIQASRPEVKSIAIEPGSKIGQASVSIIARQPIARWSIDGDNQYVDDAGIVFGRSYYGDPGLQIVDNSGLPASSSRLVASNRFLGFVGRVIAGSANNGLTVNKVTIPTHTTRQVAVNLKGKATTYKLSVDRSAGQQVEDMKRINAYLAKQHMSPSYVDIRISGKAFYR